MRLWTSRSRLARARLLLLATVALLAFGAPARAAEAAADQAAPVAAPANEVSAPADAAAEAVPADAAFTTEELRKLLAPIALYPDALLAQLLPATAYPVDIVLAARWLDKNEAAVKKDDFSGADAQGWDPSVKALVRFPDIIKALNTNLDATSDLGDAFVNQPDDVAAVIQDLRREAQKAGSLKSTPQQTVTVQQQPGPGNVVNDYVVIEPAEPGVIYVPVYDPATVYYDNSGAVAAGVIAFGTAVAVGIAIDNAWDWGHGWVYPPRWPGYPGYRPGFGGGINNGNINIGNDINIGAGNTRPWRPDPGKYHPGQGSKPGLAGRPGGAGGVARPGAGQAARPGAAARPDIASRPNVGDRAAGANRADGIGGGKAAAGDLAGKKAAAGAAVSGKGKGNGPGAGKAAAAGKAEGIKNAAAGKGANAANLKKPAGGIQKPAQAQKRPAPQRPASNTAFSGASFGGASGAMANRGAASRQSVARPAGGNRSFSGGGGGGGRPQMPHGGGGGRGGRR